MQKHPRSNYLHSFNARWPSWLALIVVAILYQALPKELYWGPRDLMLGLVGILILPLIVSHLSNRSRLSHLLTISINTLITVYMVMSVARVVMAVMQGHIGPNHLFISAVTLWLTNILVFALWYWTLDAGGPHQREKNNNVHVNSFLFPQAQIAFGSESVLPASIKNWQPHFVDYLFLAFNTSTAFSPSDTPVLTRWAKCICMIQSLVALTIVVMLAARAINILNPAGSYVIS